MATDRFEVVLDYPDDWDDESVKFPSFAEAEDFAREQVAWRGAGNVGIFDGTRHVASVRTDLTS